MIVSLAGCDEAKKTRRQSPERGSSDATAVHVIRSRSPPSQESGLKNDPTVSIRVARAPRAAEVASSARTKKPSSPLSPPSLTVAANAGLASANVVAATTAACDEKRAKVSRGFAVFDYVFETLARRPRGDASASLARAR